MTAPNDRTDRHLPSATTRAIVRENLTEHLVQASANAGDGWAMPRLVAEAIVGELLDVAYRIEHQPRGDRIRVTLNAPPVAAPLPVTGDGTAERPYLIGDRPQTAVRGARAEQAQIAGEVTADGSTVLPPTSVVDAGADVPPYEGMVSDGQGNWFGPEEAAEQGVTGQRQQCGVWSEGVRCRFFVHEDESPHTFGGGMGDPVDLKHCGEPEEHLAHAWRPNSTSQPHACSGEPLTQRPTVGPGEHMTEGDGSPDDVAATGSDEPVPPADFE